MKQRQHDNDVEAGNEMQVSRWWDWEFEVTFIGVLLGLMEVQHDVLLPGETLYRNILTWS